MHLPLVYFTPRVSCGSPRIRGSSRFVLGVVVLEESGRALLVAPWNQQPHPGSSMLSAGLLRLKPVNTIVIGAATLLLFLARHRKFLFWAFVYEVNRDYAIISLNGKINSSLTLALSNQVRQPTFFLSLSLLSSFQNMKTHDNKSEKKWNLLGACVIATLGKKYVCCPRMSSSIEVNFIYTETM